MPPPEHYALTIEGQTHGGDARIVFTPGYSAERRTPWVETFRVDPLKAAALQTYLHTARVFERPWTACPNHTVGGSTRGFHLRQGALQVDIPQELSPEDAQAADTLERLIRALVPDDTWTALRARHARYVECGDA